MAASVIDAEELALLETKWWQGHHRKDIEKVVQALSSQFVMLFGLSNEDALKAAKLKLEAGHQHDLAEQAEDAGKWFEAEAYWNQARELLRQHFEMIINRQLCSWCEQPKHTVDFICDECFNANFTQNPTANV